MILNYLMLCTIIAILPFIPMRFFDMNVNRSFWEAYKAGGLIILGFAAVVALLSWVIYSFLALLGGLI